MTTPDWLKPGEKAARIAGSHDRPGMVLVVIKRLTSTQVVVEDQMSHEEERFRVKDLRKIGHADSWRPAPRLADPTSPEVAAIRTRARRDRARAHVFAAEQALQRAAGTATENAAIAELRAALDALEGELQP